MTRSVGPHPAHVEAGPGGDFYALDQHRDRIVRLSSAGKVFGRRNPIPAPNPSGNPGIMQDFRVCEATSEFVVLRRAGALDML